MHHSGLRGSHRVRKTSTVLILEILDQQNRPSRWLSSTSHFAVIFARTPRRINGSVTLAVKKFRLQLCRHSGWESDTVLFESLYRWWIPDRIYSLSLSPSWLSDLSKWGHSNWWGRRDRTGCRRYMRAMNKWAYTGISGLVPWGKRRRGRLRWWENSFKLAASMRHFHSRLMTEMISLKALSFHRKFAPPFPWRIQLSRLSTDVNLSMFLMWKTFWKPRSHKLPTENRSNPLFLSVQVQHSSQDGCSMSRAHCTLSQPLQGPRQRPCHCHFHYLLALKLPRPKYYTSLGRFRRWDSRRRGKQLEIILILRWRWRSICRGHFQACNESLWVAHHPLLLLGGVLFQGLCTVVEKPSN